MTAHAAASVVRPVVADSWRRCESAGTCREGDRLPAVRLSDDELIAYRSWHPLAPLLPLFQDLLGDSASDGGHLFAVGDADGTLLWVRGEARTRRRAERMNFVEGAAWAEEQAGTNAPGTALATQRPVQIRTTEHYNPAARPWSCAAAPVRDPDSGRLLGVLDLTGGAAVASPQALALVRATARAAEAELGRWLAVADERARVDCARLLTGVQPAALVSPGGRVLRTTGGLAMARLPGVEVGAGMGFLPDGRRVLVEPAGAGGHLVVRFVDGVPPRAEPSALWLTALGCDAALLQVDGRTLRLRPRHSEILVVLAHAVGGLSGGRLAVSLAEGGLAPVTLRAEMSRLRAVLGADLLDSMPYRLLRPVRSDFQTVVEFLADGRAADAATLYRGPLLPSSDAPAVVAMRTAVEQQLRGVVLTSGDPSALRRWVDAAWGVDDAQAWRRLADALPGGSAQRAAAAARASGLLAQLAGPATAGSPVARSARPVGCTGRQPLSNPTEPTVAQSGLAAVGNRRQWP